MSEKVVLDIIARIDQFEQTMGKAKDISKKEMGAAVKSLQGDVKAMVRESKRAARANEDAWKRSGHAAEGVKRIFDAAGGSAAGYAGVVEHLTRSVLSLSAALGPMGVAAVAAAAAIGGIAAAATAAALKTGDLVKEMQEAKKNVPISDKQALQVREMEAAIEDLKDSFNRLVVVIGAEVAPVITVIAEKMTKAIDAFQNMPAVVGWFRDLFLLLTGIHNVWDGGLFEDTLTEEQAAAIRKNREELEALNKAIEDLDTGGNNAPKRTETSMRDVNKAIEDEQKRQASNWDYLAGRYRYYKDEQLEGAEALKQAHERAMADLWDRAETDGQIRMAAKAEAEAEALLRQKLHDLEMKQLAEKEAAEERIAAKRKAEFKAWKNEQVAMIRETARAEQARVDIVLQSTLGIMNSFETMANHAAQLLASGTEKQRKASKIAFRIAQNLALGQTIMNTAVGMSRALSEHTYPLSLLVAANVAAAGAASTLTIATQKPNFATGGVMEMDHRPAMLQAGEGVLTRAGVNAVGGAAGIDAINQGRAGGAPQPAYVVFDHRWYDRGARQNIQRGGAISQAIGRRSRPMGHAEYKR